MNQNPHPQRRTSTLNPHKYGKPILDPQVPRAIETTVSTMMLSRRQNQQITVTKRISGTQIGSFSANRGFEGLRGRYGFLQVPTGNCETPETRNQNIFAKANGLAKLAPRKKKKLLSRGKRDILLQSRNADEEKMTAKELERSKKWRDMAIPEQLNGTLHYHFPITKKVPFPRTSRGTCWLMSSWYKERSRASPIVGERQSGMNSSIPKHPNATIANQNPN